MTSPPTAHEPLSRTARATRTRILEAALRELGRDADSSLGDIAEAAGVARRTVYAHFAGRAALVGGLAAEAGEAIRGAIAVVDASTPRRGPAPDAASALARVVLTLWPVGDRYRTLIGLARQDLEANRVSGLLTPVRDTVAGILARGQRQGVFHTGVPPGPLSRGLEAHILALLDSVNSGTWADDGTGAATTTLIAAGADRDVAASTVHHLRDANQPGCDANQPGCDAR
ncbi:TetR/AcrR family transcriptional regulator [Streptomyces sp. NPDC050988]|uniref:TetR/AcrR family transcriptional regulator n=1 Tax=Streptomyces sp. NPDC050988 TaxID=3365637 RepID=UPI003797B715